MGNAQYIVEERRLAPGVPSLGIRAALSRFWLLLACGLGIEGLYLFAAFGPFSLLVHGTELADLGLLTTHSVVAGVLITLGLIVLFALYGTALERLVCNASFGLPIVLGGTVLFSLTLIFLYPVTAMDVYNYAVLGHVVTFHGLNPLITAPASVQGDAFISYGGIWAESTSPYGPVWIGVSALDSLIAGWNVIRAVLILKSISALGVVATTILLAGAATRWRIPKPALAAALFGWNPLVQLELVGNGHNDSIMIALLVLSLLLLAARRAPGGAIALAASVFVKYLTVVALPFYLLAELRRPGSTWRDRLPTVLASVAVFALTAVLAYAPFWAGPAILARVRQVDTNYLASFSALALIYMPRAIDWLLGVRVAIVAAIALWQINAFLRGRASVARAVFEVYFGVLLVATHFAGWYLPLLVALGVLSADRWLVARAITFTFAAMLTVPLWQYVWPEVQNTYGLGPFHLLIVPLTFFPPLLIGAWGRWQSSR